MCVCVCVCVNVHTCDLDRFAKSDKLEPGTN